MCVKLSHTQISDKQLQQLLGASPKLQTLEIDSLQNITAVPDQFPETLKSVTLGNVPQDLVFPFVEKLGALGVDNIEITGRSEKPTETQNV